VGTPPADPTCRHSTRTAGTPPARRGGVPTRGWTSAHKCGRSAAGAARLPRGWSAHHKCGWSACRAGPRCGRSAAPWSPARVECLQLGSAGGVPASPSGRSAFAGGGRRRVECRETRGGADCQQVRAECPSAWRVSRPTWPTRPNRKSLGGEFGPPSEEPLVGT
jgi:hypothetical protein